MIVSHGYNREASLAFDEAIVIPKKDDYYFEGKATGETAQPGIFAAGDILRLKEKSICFSEHFKMQPMRLTRLKRI